MTQPRLCFVGWADHVHLERWAGYFGARAPGVSVVSFTGPGRYPPQVRQLSVGLRRRSRRWQALRLRYLLWRLRPQVVHAHWAHFAVPVRRAWRGPLVVTAWGSDIYRRENFTDAQWAELGEALRSAECVTCDSDDLARTMREAFGLDAGRVHVIQWGVDTDLFTLDGPDMRAELGLQGREVVLSARNFTPLYDQETVVQAFARLRTRRPAAFLLMKNHGGDAAYLAQIRALVTTLGLSDAVRILDSMPYERMAELYRTADATVSVPHSDATPMSLLEAMAAGSPCVACDLPSIREWVTDGETGLLVRAGDVDAVSRAMEQAITPGPARDALRRRARELVVGRASQHVHMRSAAEHYRALAARR